MKKKRDKPPHAGALRRRALRRISEQSNGSGPAGQISVDPVDTQRLLHELQVHQVELEIQNEELRAARAEVEAGLEKYYDLYDFAPVGYFTLERTGTVREANLAGAALLGVARSFLIGRRFSGFVAEGSQGVFEAFSSRVCTAEGKSVCEVAIRGVGRDSRHVHLEGAAVEEKTGVTDHRWRMTATDITARQQVEDAQAFLLHCGRPGSGEGFFAALARYLAGNLGMEYICIDRLEGDGLSARTLAVFHQGRFEDNVSYALKDTPCGEAVGKVVCCFPEGVCRLFPRDRALQDLGAESYVGTTLWDSQGRPIGLIAVIGRKPLADRRWAETLLALVSGRAAGELERTQAEEALRESERRLREIASSLPGAVYQFVRRPDGSHAIPFMSEGAVPLLGRSLGELTDSSRLFDDVHPGDLPGLWASIAESAATLGRWKREFRVVSRSGEVKWMQGVSNPTRLADGGVCWNGVLLEITDRKQAEERLRIALAEKETLLRELYHRTKNNMQVIRSMLALRAAQLQDPAVSRLFRETEDRIQAMAMAHQMLYRAKDLSRIDLREYLGELAALLMKSYNLSPDRVVLHLDLAAERVLLDIAIPCGLVMSELLSNALKYAFPGDRSGAVNIRLTRNSPQTLELEFSDDGVGLPAGFDFRQQPSLGFQTIITLVEHQLQGEAQLASGPGVTWRLRFNDALYAERV